MKNPLISLSSVLEDLFKNKNSVFSEIYFLYRLNEKWCQLVGEEIAKMAVPIQFKNKELILNMSDSTYLQEMYFAKELLKKKINKNFPDKKVEKISLRVKKTANPFLSPLK